MAQNRLVFPGLEQLIVAMRNLPKDLANEASGIVIDAANDASAEIRAGYPEVTGNLRNGVSVAKQDVGQFQAGAVVKNTSPHAWLYDRGSRARHWASGKSTGKMWGKTRPTHLFVRTTIKHRHRMYSELKALLVSKGLIVTGNE